MKKKFSLKKEYKSCWKYLKESKKFIYIIVGIFFVSFFLGFFISPSGAFLQTILDFIAEILEKTQGMSLSELIIFILFNNFQSSFLGMVFGFALGIFPVFAAISNGYLLGFVSHMSVVEEGVISLWRIFPHGIFELPAIFISLGLGLKISTFIFYNKKLEKFKLFFSKSLRVFLFIVIPLLIIAAIIEGIFIIFLN